MELKTNLIILTQEKLISIDSVIPVVMELKSRFPERFKISLIFPTSSNYEKVCENSHLLKAINEISPEIIIPDRGANIFSRGLFLVGLFLKYMFRRNIFLKYGNTLFKHASFMHILKMFSQTIEVKYQICPNTREEMRTFGVDATTRAGKAQVESSVMKFCSEEAVDYFLLTMSAEEYEKYYHIVFPYPDKIIKVGYIRRLPEWNKFFDKIVAEYKFKENYFLFNVIYIDKRSEEYNEPTLSELHRESLLVMHKFCDRLHTVFRLHPGMTVKQTDEFNSFLAEIGYSNYSFALEHPSVLSAHAKFVFSVIFSSIMFDSYFLGVPTVEYCDYDKDFLRGFGDSSYGGKCCDFFIKRDPVQLEKCIRDIIDGKAVVARDKEFMDYNFPETEDEFYKFWEKI